MFFLHGVLSCHKYHTTSPHSVIFVICTYLHWPPKAFSGKHCDRIFEIVSKTLDLPVQDAYLTMGANKQANIEKIEILMQ